MRQRVIIPAICAALLPAALLLAPPAALADAQPGYASFYNSRVALNADTTVFILGNDLNNVQSLGFTCTKQKFTISPIKAVRGSSNRLATMTVPTSVLAGVPAGDTCQLTTSNPINGPTFAPTGGFSLYLYVRAAAPVVKPPTPKQVEASFPVPGPAPTIRVAAGPGTSLANVTGVSGVLCTASPGEQVFTNIEAVTTQVSFTPKSLPPQSCAILLRFKDGSSQLVPDSKGNFRTALTYTSWVIGRIRIEITNNSDVPDNQLHVGIMADASGGGSVSGYPGVNKSTVTSVAFTKLTNSAGQATYTTSPSSDDTGGTAYFDVRQPVDSGVIYLANGSLNGQNAPNPQTSTVRYAMAEFTYDKGFFTDLTLIDQIGFAVSSRLYTDLPGTQRIANSYRTTGCLANLVSQLQKIVPAQYWAKASSDDSSGGVIRYDRTGTKVVGYTGAAKKPWAYMTSQVKAYAQHVQTLGPLSISDSHNAANQSGPFDYTATYSASTDIWTLAGTMTDGTVTPGPTLYVEGASIYGPGSNDGTGYAMYGQDGPFRVVLPNGTDYGWGNGVQVAGTGFQDLVKTIYRDFIAGYAYGYWGGRYGKGTSTGPLAINFTLNPRTSAYNNAGVAQQYAAWNTYDQMIRMNTSGGGGAAGAYGTAYSDTFLPEGLSPAIGSYAARNWTITLGDPAGCAPA